jgi:hypothetical protein
MAERTDSGIEPTGAFVPAAKTEQAAAAADGQLTSDFDANKTIPPITETGDVGSMPLPTFPGYEILGVLGRGGMASCTKHATWRSSAWLPSR